MSNDPPGYLFFLSTGIFFGFKKPLMFFPFSSIDSISYTSVLQRTFNLVIKAIEPGSSDAKEYELSMIDQADYAGIDQYIKRHQLNDASLAADRRAKAYNVNKDKKTETEDGEMNGSGDGMTELQKAEQALQDAEDEEEEDYEASGGESDGEGEDSSEGEAGQSHDEMDGDGDDDDDNLDGEQG